MSERKHSSLGQHFRKTFPYTKIRTAIEVEHGSVRGETNPWSEHQRIETVAEFKYRTKSSNRYQWQQNVSVLNQIIYVHVNSHLGSPLFTWYWITLEDDFKFSVYRQLSKEVPPLLIGTYASYQAAVKKCTCTIS